MPLAHRHRLELEGIAALLAGVFVSLSLTPIDVTGPIGEVFGGFLWQYLGAGAVMVPASFFAVGASNIDGS